MNTEPILAFFRFGHLPPALQAVSQRFAFLAHEIVATLPRSAERTVALRKLLEAKDAATRAALPPIEVPPPAEDDNAARAFWASLG
jgi:hypothetical protein